MKEIYQVGKGNIDLVQGSVTRYSADALVCPANADLEMVAFPGGVQYAFLIEGGEEIFREVSKLGQKLSQTSMDTLIPMAVPETSAHITGAGKLPAKYVIHSVAVAYDPKKDTIYCDPDVIGRSVVNVLELAKQKKLKSVGFPALGTGLYEVPLENAVDAMSRKFSEHLQNETTIERIGLILYSPGQYNIGKEVMDRKFRSH